MPFFRHLCVSKVIATAHAYKSDIIFIFSKSFQTTKIKSLQPKRTKIASRWSCLKTAEEFVWIFERDCISKMAFKVARNEFKNGSFAQKRKTRMFFRQFFWLSANFQPHSGAIFHTNTHIIFCCPLSAYDKWWFEQKKKKHHIFGKSVSFCATLRQDPLDLSFFFLGGGGGPALKENCTPKP